MITEADLSGRPGQAQNRHPQTGHLTFQMGTAETISSDADNMLTAGGSQGLSDASGAIRFVPNRQVPGAFGR